MKYVYLWHDEQFANTLPSSSTKTKNGQGTKFYELVNKVSVDIWKYIHIELKLVYTPNETNIIKCDDSSIKDVAKVYPTLKQIITNSEFIWKLNSMALVPSWLYLPSDRRMWTKLVPNLTIEGVVLSAQQIPTTVNLDFLDPEPLLSIQVAPQLSSRGWVDPVPDPLLLQKSGSAGNRTRQKSYNWSMTLRVLAGRDRFFFFSFLIYTVGRTPLTGKSPSRGRYLHTE
jgi:hypothetical protein